MSKPSPEIEAKARERLAADEQRIARAGAAGAHHRLAAYLPDAAARPAAPSGGTPRRG